MNNNAHQMMLAMLRLFNEARSEVWRGLNTHEASEWTRRRQMMKTGADNKDKAKGHLLQSKQREISSETTSVSRQQIPLVCLA